MSKKAVRAHLSTECCGMRQDLESAMSASHRAVRGFAAEDEALAIMEASRGAGYGAYDRSPYGCIYTADAEATRALVSALAAAVADGGPLDALACSDDYLF
jgi:hypothetical protein